MCPSYQTSHEPSSDEPLIIGVSARIHYPLSPDHDLGNVYAKTLHYMEQSIAHWVTDRNVITVLIPALNDDQLRLRAGVGVAAYARMLDGLLLQPGSDISPKAYGETPKIPEWEGDAPRDRYELDLFDAFVAEGKPVLGICRGCQLINVAMGGSLYQDIPSELGDTPQHRDSALYERILHDVQIVAGTRMAQLYPGKRRAKINSIHHQAIKTLGKDLVIEAISLPDGLAEAIRWHGPSYVVGFQWHPEFLDAEQLDDSQLDGMPIVDEFLAHVRLRRDGRS